MQFIGAAFVAVKTALPMTGTSELLEHLTMKLCLPPTPGSPQDEFLAKQGKESIQNLLHISQNTPCNGKMIT